LPWRELRRRTRFAFPRRSAKRHGR
jgi:hypothetical protein